MPNLASPTFVEGKNAKMAVTTSATALVANSTGSEKTIRVVSLYIANVDGVNAASVTVDIYDGTAARCLVKTVAVPADSTLTVIGRDDSIYLEEGDSLRLTASAANDLEAIASYEEIL